MTAEQAAGEVLLVSSRMKLRQKRITKSRSGNLQPWSGDLEHAAAENKMQLAGLNSQLKEQETDWPEPFKAGTDGRRILRWNGLVAAKERESRKNPQA